MPLRPAAGKHEPPSPPRQDQQQQHTHSPSRKHAHAHTHAASSSRGASTDSGSSQEEDSGVPSPAGVQAFRPVAEHHSAGAPMEEPTGNTVVIRIGIPDLQQTVRACFLVTAVDRLKRGKLPFLLLYWQRLLPSLLSAFMLYFLRMIFLISSVSTTSFFIFGSCSSFSLFSVCTLSNCTVIAGSWAFTPHCLFHTNNSTSTLTELQLTLTTSHFRWERGEEGEKVSVSKCRLADLPELSDLRSSLLLLLLLLFSVALCPGRDRSATPHFKLLRRSFPKSRASQFPTSPAVKGCFHWNEGTWGPEFCQYW